MPGLYGFIWVTYVLSEIRNGSDAVKKGDLRLSRSTSQQDIKKRASVHQAHETNRTHSQLLTLYFLL